METRQDYFAVVDKIRSFCRERCPNLLALYLGGSVARGDFVPGRIDIDLYAVTAEKDAELEDDIKAYAEELGRTMLKSVAAIHPSPVGVSFTTLKEIEDGCSFLGAGYEYWNFINTGKLLYGEDIRSRLPGPTREEVEKSATEALKQLKELLAFPPPAGDKGIAMTFNLIFRGVCTYLSGRGRYVSAKEECVKAFCQEFPDLPQAEDLQRALQLYKKWSHGPLTGEEFSELVGLARRIILALSA
ncbi:MAG TPA: nucleotidyltransferase domain-containing protein [Bacillota bacterium]|nr:nucleotidyltransferase domain-containing protein [Bacillota bacterium]